MSSPVGSRRFTRAVVDVRPAELSSEEEAEFVRVFTDLFPRAYRVAYRLLGQREAAEDAAAEALGRAYAFWSRVGPFAL